jgi:hypothetical protein
VGLSCFNNDAKEADKPPSLVPAQSRAQTLADTGFGENELRPLRVGFDLLPQLAHGDIELPAPFCVAAGACRSDAMPHCARG